MNLFPSAKIVASTRRILGLPVCDFTMAEALAFADEVVSMPFGQTVIAFLNANTANLMSQDPEYRAILERQVVLPDGHGVDIASWVTHGSMFPSNLNGTDFVPALMTYVDRPMRVAMVGGRHDVLVRAAEAFKSRTPWHDFVPVSDGYFTPDRSDAIMAEVRRLQPDILLVALGSPKQEKWIDRHVGPGHARLVIGVGALFDFMAGEFPRAPLALRRMRLEWLHRLVLEPSRLWRRYLLGIPVFIYYVLRQKLTGRDTSDPRRHPAGHGPNRPG